MADSQFPSSAKTLADQIGETIKRLSSTGADTSAMLAEQRKNIEAMIQASQIANDGAHAVLQRQFQLFHDTSERLVRFFAEVDLTPQERSELAKSALEATLAGSREVAELAAKTSEATFAVAQERLADGVLQMQKPPK